MKLEDKTSEMGILSVQGPKSRELLSLLVDCDLSNQQFPFGTTKTAKVAGHLCRLMRLSFVGELGWELHLPNQSCLPVLKVWLLF